MSKYKLMPTLIEGKRQYVHRYVWEQANGPIPAGMCIDHINRDHTDNRLENLRLATYSQNFMNSMHQQGKWPRGVTTRGSKFRAQIAFEGKHRWLGTFNCPTAAHFAYLKARLALSPEFAAT